MPDSWRGVSAVKQLRYPRIEDLHRAQRALIANQYDDWNLVTGRVGKGKSKWARKNARKLDPSFGLDRIHWREESFWAQYVTLKPGQCIILDEFNGHRRAAMHGERLSFLERMKRVRSRFVHAWIVYDRVSSLDRDLLTDRNAFWHHTEVRGNMQVRQPYTSLRFKHDSTPIEPTKYPLVGDFEGFTGWEPPGFEEAYERRKDEEMSLLGREDDPEPAPRDPAAAARINMALVDLAQKELGRVAA